MTNNRANSSEGSGKSPLSKEPQHSVDKICMSEVVVPTSLTGNFRNAFSRLVYEEDPASGTDEEDSLESIYDEPESSAYSTSHGQGFMLRFLTCWSQHVNLSKRGCIILGCAISFFIAIVVGQTVGHVTRSSNRSTPSSSPPYAPLPPTAMTLNDPSVIPKLLVQMNILDASQTTIAALGQTNPTATTTTLSPQQLAINYLATTTFSHTQLLADELRLNNNNIDDWESTPVLRTLVELYVLAVIYYSTLGAEWLQNTRWLQPDLISPCSWHGVTCDDDSRVVKQLDLSGNMLVGQLPSEIQYLKSLEILNLSDNGLMGELPPTVPTSLEFLLLSKNHFESTIPAWDHATFLIVLDLSENDLKGPIVATMWESLAILKVQHNFLTGRVPYFPHLMSIFADNNRFTEWPIMDDMSMLTHLEELSVRENHFHGSIMNEEFGRDYPNLKLLDVSENGLQGNLEFLVDLTQLTHVNVAQNQFTGTLPVGLASTMTSIVGHHNQLTGLISLDGMEVLEELNLGYNLFSDTPLPTTLSSSLQLLDLSHNALTGTIPDIASLQQLKTLHLQVNQLTGSVPSSLDTISTLQSVKLEENSFTGDVSVCDLKVLSADCEMTCSCCTACY